MAESTGISWTDHTHNEWWGCSSPAGAGCDHCYAVKVDKRFGGNHFGRGTKPRLTKEQNRNKPYRWNRLAQAAGERKKVFCGSMMDFFSEGEYLKIYQCGDSYYSELGTRGCCGGDPTFGGYSDMEPTTQNASKVAEEYVQYFTRKD